ncbi:hypothetical protein PARHAE_00765 [Paracoccus haematequi]|uniref:Uncharacterized protein n=2 Tax=Paracoccus haematequi TaxID=2491866 RepID=A0A447IJ76_9RHOB|nr:hypothetical protein PARHAE_00765 [Paracoccus haematequi]
MNEEQIRAIVRDELSKQEVKITLRDSESVSPEMMAHMRRAAMEVVKQNERRR